VTFVAESDELRIVAETSVAAALIENGVELVGVFGQLEDAQGNPYGGVDFSGIANVGGAAYGEINLEALSEVDPDVIVTIAWATDSYWWIDTDIADEMQAIAPLLVVEVSDGAAGVPAPAIIERFDELAVALGGTGATAESKARYEAAEAALVAAVEAKPEITLMFASSSTDTFYIADPPAWPDLSYYASLGVPVLRTETTEGGFWEYLSLESIDKYDVDLILLDDRDPGQGARLAADVPLWPTLPAVAAEQVVLWPISGRVYTYAGFAEVLELITEAVNASTDVS
jgi:iron complex transport system substrate-binding protein